MTRYYDETLGAVADQSRDVIREQMVGEELDNITIPAKVVYEMWDDAARKLIDIYPVVELDRLIDFNYTAEKLVKSADGLSYEMQATEMTLKPVEHRAANKLSILDGRLYGEERKLLAGYPETEVKTFVQQVREAEVYLINPGAASPLLDGMVASGRRTKAGLVTSILENSAILKPKIGNLLDIYQGLRDRLKAGGEPDEINWPE